MLIENLKISKIRLYLLKFKKTKVIFKNFNYFSFTQFYIYVLSIIRSHSALPLVRHSQQVYLNALNANLQQQNQQQQQQQQPPQQQQQPQMQANFNNGLINGTNNYPYKMADQPPQPVQRANTFMYQPSTTTTTNNPINALNSATLNRARYRGTSVDKAAF
jgi:transcription initiation factor TFIID subunit TAF12